MEKTDSRIEAALSAKRTYDLGNIETLILVGMVLDANEREDRLASKPVSAVARDLGLTQRHVARAFAALKKAGCIEKVGTSDDRVSIYRITVPGCES